MAPGTTGANTGNRHEARRGIVFATANAGERTRAGNRFASDRPNIEHARSW